MKSAKTHRTLLTIMMSLFVLSLILFFTFAFAPANSVSADTKIASSYFTGINSVEFKDNFMVATVTGDSEVKEELSNPQDSNSEKITVENNVLTIKNELVVSDFEMVIKKVEGLKELTVVFKSDAYYANGNVSDAYYVNGNIINGKLESEVVNKLTFDIVNQKFYFNGQDAEAKTFDANADITLKTKVENNYLVATVGAESVTATDISKDGAVIEYRKIKNVNDMAAAEIKFMFKLAEAVTSSEFKIESIDQKVSDGNGAYKQTFGEAIDNAFPRIAVNEDFYQGKKSIMKSYTLTMTTYSVLGEVKASDVFVKDADDASLWTETGTKTPKTIQFTTAKTYTLEIGDKNKVYEKISVVAINLEENPDETAPEYVDFATADAGAKASYELALREAYYDSENKHYKPLGTSITLPSLKDFVSDDVNAYEELSMTVYYNTDTKDSATTSSLTLSISEVGDYEYYVTFTDASGNKMEQKDFIGDKDDANYVKKYVGYVFKFHVADDAPILVTAPISQGKGFVGISYTASKFNVDASGCTTTYKLYYNSSLEASVDSEWILIPNASSVTDEEYNQDGFDYDAIKEIAYAGGLTFTPDRIGSYMIECSATSSASSRSAVEYSIIRIEEEPTIVKVPSTWLKDNVWSVVFLSVGTLCLIGIIVLLCIKPKEETEAE